jgi:hypothetical protein
LKNEEKLLTTEREKTTKLEGEKKDLEKDNSKIQTQVDVKASS